MTIIYQVLATSIICYIFTTLGILYTLPSSTVKLFRSENTTLDRIMTETEISLMGSLSSASTLIVTPFCGYLLDQVGRKMTMVIFYLPQLEAAKAIAFYRGCKPNSKLVNDEIVNLKRIISLNIETIDGTPEEIKLKPEETISKKLSIWKYLAKSRSSRRALLRTFTVVTSSIFQGIVVVQMFAEPLFTTAIPSMSPTVSSVLFASVSIIAGIVGAYLVDTVGRRLLLIIASLATGLCSVVLGTQLHFNWGTSWMTVLLILLYAVSYILGAGSVPMVLLGEVFLPEIRSFASMLCVEWAFISSFYILFIFNPLFNTLGQNSSKDVNLSIQDHHNCSSLLLSYYIRSNLL